jgi:hypothetical protein
MWQEQTFNTDARVWWWGLGRRRTYFQSAWCFLPKREPNRLFAKCWNIKLSGVVLEWVRAGSVADLLWTNYCQTEFPTPNPCKEKFVYEACRRICAIATQAHNQEHTHIQSHFLPVAVKWYLVYTQGSEGSSTHHLTMKDGLYVDRKHFFIVSLSMVVSYVQYLVATKCLIYLPTYIVTTYTLYLLTYDTNHLTWGIS